MKLFSPAANNLTHGNSPPKATHIMRRIKSLDIFTHHEGRAVAERASRLLARSPSLPPRNTNKSGRKTKP